MGELAIERAVKLEIAVSMVSEGGLEHPPPRRRVAAPCCPLCRIRPSSLGGRPRSVRMVSHVVCPVFAAFDHGVTSRTVSPPRRRAPEQGHTTGLRGGSTPEPRVLVAVELVLP